MKSFFLLPARRIRSVTYFNQKLKTKTCGVYGQTLRTLPRSGDGEISRPPSAFQGSAHKRQEERFTQISRAFQLFAQQGCHKNTSFTKIISVSIMESIYPVHISTWPDLVRTPFRTRQSSTCNTHENFYCYIWFYNNAFYLWKHC